MRDCSVVGDCIFVRASFGGKMRRLTEKMSWLFEESQRLERKLKEKLQFWIQI